MDSVEKKAKLEELMFKLVNAHEIITEVRKKVVFDGHYIKYHDQIKDKLQEVVSADLTEAIALLGRQIDEINEGKE